MVGASSSTAGARVLSRAPSLRSHKAARVRSLAKTDRGWGPFRGMAGFPAPVPKSPRLLLILASTCAPFAGRHKRVAPFASKVPGRLLERGVACRGGGHCVRALGQSKGWTDRGENEECDLRVIFETCIIPSNSTHRFKRFLYVRLIQSYAWEQDAANSFIRMTYGTQSWPSLFEVTSFSL